MEVGDEDPARKHGQSKKRLSISGDAAVLGPLDVWATNRR